MVNKIVFNISKLLNVLIVINDKYMRLWMGSINLMQLLYNVYTQRNIVDLNQYNYMSVINKVKLSNKKNPVWMDDI